LEGGFEGWDGFGVCTGHVESHALIEEETGVAGELLDEFCVESGGFVEFVFGEESFCAVCFFGLSGGLALEKRDGQDEQEHNSMLAKNKGGSRERTAFCLDCFPA
jgi:hypothetical protein